MMSVYMQKVYDLAKEYDKNLLCTYSRLRHSVRIIHEDGSILFFEDAFLMKHNDSEGEWIIIFTEHHGFHVYHGTELYNYTEFMKVEGKIPELK